MRKTKLIKVTKSHIKEYNLTRGESNLPSISCPVALALKRTCKKKVIVELNWLKVGNSKYLLNKVLDNFIENVDWHEKVHPISFRLSDLEKM